MSAHILYTQLLRDEELCSHLEKRDTLLFEGLASEWQHIERQVERLGFGERYIVSQGSSKKGCTKLSPLEAG